jgi:tetratricopeptide (TPR) repeat protein
LKDQQKYSEAELLFREALNDFRRSLQPDNPDIAVAMSSLAAVLTDQQKYTEAEPLYRDTLEFFRRVLPANHARIDGTLYGLGNLLLLQGKPAEAESLLAELYQSLQRPSALQRSAPARLSLYGQCLMQLHRYAEAEQPLRQAYQRGKQASPPNHLIMRRALAALAEVYDHTGRPSDAGKVRVELAALEAATQPATAPTIGPN